jgi:uncharacterized protein YoxC
MMDLNLTYDELSEQLGISRNAARVLVQRKKWHRWTSQEDGRTRVRVPAEAMTELTNRRAAARAGHVLPHVLPSVRPDDDGMPPSDREFRLADMIGLLLDRVAADETARRDEVARLRQDQNRLIAERDRLQDDLQKARADADQAKTEQARMAQEVAAMFAELRSLADRHAEMHADRARLETQIATDAEHRARLEMDVAGLKSELDQECARSADLKTEAEHQAREINRLSVELEQAGRPW